MQTRLLNLWEKLRTSFWPVPGGLTAAAAALAFLTIGLDRRLDRSAFDGMNWLAEASADGVRSLLSTVAAAMLTTAGVVFSVTIVALTTASGQFGPRLLRNFIKARSTQVVLGALLGTFLFCLLVLSWVHAGNPPGSTFIPRLSVLVALILTVVTLGLFIVFIHSIAVSLQADRIVAEVTRDLDDSINRLFPSDREEGDLTAERREQSACEDLISALGDEARPLTSSRDGYLQAIDLDGLIGTACRLDLRMQIICRPGHFMHTGGTLARVAGAPLSEEEEATLRECFLIGSDRTPEQDFEFSIRQLVEVAVRALSPGINDPFTAVTCIDYLGAALGRIANRRLPPALIRDEDGEPRLTVWPTSFDRLLACAFDQIRQHARDNVAVSLRLLEALERLASQTRSPEQDEAVRTHAELVAAGSRDAAHAEEDRSEIDKRLERILSALARHDRSTDA